MGVRGRRRRATRKILKRIKGYSLLAWGRWGAAVAIRKRTAVQGSYYDTHCGSLRHRDSTLRTGKKPK